MELKLINMKIKAPQFTHCGCGNLNEYDAVKALFNDVYAVAQSGKIITIKQLSKMITEAGKAFAQNTTNVIFQEELYNKFVGDTFELFAEFFFKTCSAMGQYGVINYEPAVNMKDWGVDGSGICADQREVSGGTTPAVIQVKFRSNPMDEISYTMLAKTGWDGIKNYGLNVNRKNNIILFCNTESGANYLAKEAISDNLYVIDMKKLDKDVTGIRTIAFWKAFVGSL